VSDASNPKSKVKLRHSGRQLKKGYDMITTPTVVRFR